MLSRMEHDSIGALNVPAEAYYGVQSMRAATNLNNLGLIEPSVRHG